MNFLKSMFAKKWPVILFTALLIFIGVRMYYQLTDDFRLANMTYEISHHPEWEIAELPVIDQIKMQKILDQTFTYVGKGAQSYVFSSEDGQYVIKFFKFKHLKPSLFVDLLPPVYPFAGYKKSQQVRKARKLNGVFNGYHLSYEKHKEESGLFFIHLNKTTTLHKRVVVKDKLGLSHIIYLDSVVFLIQEKGETLSSVMNSLLKKGDIVQAKQRIRQVFDLYYAEYQKGIYDHDHAVMQNTGFTGTKPIHLDVGKMHSDPQIKEPARYKSDLLIIYSKIDRWYKVNYPQYREELSADMHQKFLELI